jgi:hypothetical protein
MENDTHYPIDMNCLMILIASTCTRSIGLTLYNIHSCYELSVIGYELNRSEIKPKWCYRFDVMISQAAGLGIMMDNATAYGSTYMIIQFIKNLELL